PRWTSRLELVALTATLATWLWFLLAIGGAALLVAVRLVRARIDPGQARAPGWLAPPPPLRGDARPAVARCWAVAVTALASAVVVQRVAAIAIARYNELQLKAAV